ncbi:MAG: hypothetical protein UMU76_07945 [Prosthecochloris sp.]|nr:hypothetical protein [Prosthecochloris sp.]
MKNVPIRSLLLCLVLVFPLQSCVVNRPVHPGPGFVWVAPYTVSSGVVIRGHWKYVGPPQRQRVWVPAHYNRRGHWVRGHWKALKAPRHRNAVWIPGWRTPSGRWHPGHWRYR